MSQSKIIKATDLAEEDHQGPSTLFNTATKNRSRTSLTNAEHHAMKKDHSLLANQISEMPHHYFNIEKPLMKSPETRNPVIAT